MKTPAVRSSSSSRFLRACRRLPVDKIPVWFMRQAGRYMKEYRALRERHSILELAKTPELACEVTLQPVRAFPVDAAIIFADILLPLEPLGLGLRFAPGPAIDNPIRTAEDVSRLREFDVRAELAFVFEAVRLARAALNGLPPCRAGTPLIGFAGAPFTLASYMIEGGPSKDFGRTKAFMHAQPRAWDRLMRRLCAVTIDYLKGQIEAGAQAVQLFDSWAGALSPAEYRAFVLPHSRRALKAVSRADVPAIHFGTGTAGFLEDFGSAGGDVVGVDWRVDIGAAWKRIGPRAIQGNLDPALLNAPEKTLKSAVRDILRQAGHRHGFVFNVGHGLGPQTPPERVRAVAEWVHAWR